MERMYITDLNSAGGIGANSLFVELGPFSFLIDAGLDPKEDGLRALPALQQTRGQLDFIILTHCHLDHLGALPIALRMNPEADIFCTKSSQKLAPRMLGNSYNVMRRIRDEKGIAEYPLFTKIEIQSVEEKLRALPFEKPFTFYKNDEEIEITFYQAGHVPGATAVKLVYKHRIIFFTGDVLFESQKIIPGAEFPQEEIDTLIIETTRGATESEEDVTRESESERLVASLQQTLSGGGTVLVPAFAFGRMQEILKIVHQGMKEGKLAECPIFCAGLGVKLSDTLDQLSKKSNQVDFRWQIIKDLKIRNPDWNMRPGHSPEPGLYVLGSGMLVENTPSYRMAASILENPHHKICFVGYCDPDTPGGKLLEAEQGESFLFEALDYVAPVRARVERFQLSGHANREELLAFALAADPRSVFLTHGDADARQWFEEEILMVAGKTKVIDPEPLKRYHI